MNPSHRACPGRAYQVTPSGLSSTNYAISFVPGTLSVTPAPLAIHADDQTMIYGGQFPAQFTATITGLVEGDTPAMFGTLAFSTLAAPNSSVGDYHITAGGATNPNYTFNYVDGTLTITPAPLTIRVDDKTKLYGASLPELTASYDGLVNGDSAASLTTLPTLTSTATAASHVGLYEITAAGAVDPNYSITYVAGTLSVTPAPLTITADNKTKDYGMPLPELTASYAGWVNGDTPASLATPPTLSTTATDTSPVGTYPITITGATSPDYSITLINGTLTVVSAMNGAFLAPDPLNPTKMALYVYGSSIDDLILVSPAIGRNALPGDVSVSMNFKSQGIFHPTSRIIVHGMEGDDYIWVSDRINLPAWVYGDGGNDVLVGGGGPNIMLGGGGMISSWAAEVVVC